MLDDILSSLDVHTAQWIVDDCLAGDLVQGRTVLLVTHNILLARPVAHYVVVIAMDGTIQSQGPVSDVMRKQPSLGKVPGKETNFKDKERENVAQENIAKLQAAKLIVAEKQALGRVDRPACKCSLLV